MGNKVSGRSFLPILLVFIFSSLFIWFARPMLAGWNADHRVLLIGNGLLFGVTGVSYWLYIKVLQNANMHAFLRMMYGSLLIKMLACLIATFIYAYTAGRGVNRNGVIGCFILYIIYTFLEVKILIKTGNRPAGSNKETPGNA